MHYTISCTSPNTHFIDIILKIEDIGSAEIFLQLPAWRPGRYELANFAKNIQYFKVYDERKEALPFRKVSKDRSWIGTQNISSLSVHYNFYAFQMDAGNSWVDENQWYINFINCLVYDEKRLEEKCVVHLILPEDYQIACGLAQPQKHILEAENYYQLVDSPMIASNLLKQLNYIVFDYSFHIWFMGNVFVQEEKILKDFQSFTQKQIEMMEGFPHPEYHFLVQILPYKHYHGVEHFNSTVITIGPSEKFYREDSYNNFLGVSSHELFHTWNVIRIRPKELMPYNFTKENYFDTGLIAEGFTTYYGDLFLVRSGVYDKNTYLRDLNGILSKHFENHGRYNLSLAESSFDLWLDGYVQGIPNRKVSIYTKGTVIALMLDLEIRSVSLNNKSLDDLIRLLWKEYGKKSKGYKLEDIVEALNTISDFNFETFFKKYIIGVEPEEKRLEELLKYVGCQLEPIENPGYEGSFGFKLVNPDGVYKVSNIEPGSVAETYLSLDDELIAVNNRKIENNFADLVGTQTEIEVTFFRNKILKKVDLVNVGKRYWINYKIVQNLAALESEKENFQNWLGCSW